MSRAIEGKGWRLFRTNRLKTQFTAKASSQRNESTSTVNYPAGLEQWFLKSSMSQRKHGTTTHTPLQNLQCSFLPKFSIHIETKYEDNKGSNDNIFEIELKDQEREVCFVDIVYDEIPERYYKDSEDLRYFKSEKTSRGLLQEGWRDTQDPIMCSYKLVTVKFEVWGLQTRVEQFVHKVVRDVLLLGHRQAFAWVDEWIDMTMDEVREFERTIQEATNQKIGVIPPSISISETPLSSCALTGPASAPSTPMCTDAPESLSVPKDRPRKKSAPETLTLPDPAQSPAPQSSSSNQLAMSNHLQSSTPPSNSDLAEMDEQ
uniref:Phosphatidylinositol transfer protein cytoplasmic 1 n=1 Tax=Kryptolebias marmoratus TaxID=37003 RepID=A0A3Q3GID8_KRYMA